VGGGQPDSIVARWVKNRVYSEVPVDKAQHFEQLTAENANGWYGVMREPIQSFQNYRASSPARPTALRRNVVLQPLGAFTPRGRAVLKQAESFCEIYFQLHSRTAPSRPLLASKAWTRQPRAAAVGSALQFDASALLNDVLLPELPGDAALYLGVTESDLWAGNLNFVFGLGSFDRRTGIYSLARLDEKSGPVRDTVFLRRACQILAHESGHLLGLEHCVLYKCVMNGANSLADADATSLHLCPVCERKLQWSIGFDAEKRRRELTRFYRNHGLTPMTARIRASVLKRGRV
jgi:archaemetzincin